MDKNRTSYKLKKSLMEMKNCDITVHAVVNQKKNVKLREESGSSSLREATLRE